MIIRCNTYKKESRQDSPFYVSFVSASYLMKILYETLFHVSSFLVLLLLENQGLTLNDLFSPFYSFIFTPSRYFLLQGHKLCKQKSERKSSRFFHILELRRTWSSWEWNYVTDVSHASDVH